MGWDIEMHPEVESWFLALVKHDPRTADLIESALDHLAEKGPSLGRPLVDHIKTSRYPNMKELRPASAGRTEVRMLFAFDPQRKAIVLVGGDKHGQWNDWYQAHIPVADQRFAEHLARLDEEG